VNRFTHQKNSPAKCPTGIEGLDVILGGGLSEHRFYLIQGDPGVGKTTVGLSFLIEGAKRGEKGLYITLSETQDELSDVALSHGMDLSEVSIFELSAIEQTLSAESQNTLFHPAEVELNQLASVMMDKVAEVRPARVVFDSLSELRLLAQNSLRYRRQLLMLKQFFSGRKCTVLVMDDGTSDAADREVQSIAHGVIRLEQMAPDYGSERRRLTIVKIRGGTFWGGYHDFIIERGGLRVFPRLNAIRSRRDFHPGVASSGLPALDELLGGGLDWGTSTLVMGPPGTGKSTLSAIFGTAAANRGEKVLACTFDERVEIFVDRAESIGLKIRDHIESGRFEVEKVNPAELSAGNFFNRIRRAVEQDGVRMVVIDSLNGYLNGMPQERSLTVQMHELLSFLAAQGVSTILILAQHGMIGAMQSPVDVTYLADTVIMMRYFEFEGAVKQAISVVKKRSGNHERTIREMSIRADGIHVGPPLVEFQGVLTGVPKYTGSAQSVSGGKRA
jgi:circadian clock protein KaiC